MGFVELQESSARRYNSAFIVDPAGKIIAQAGYGEELI